MAAPFSPGVEASVEDSDSTTLLSADVESSYNFHVEASMANDSPRLTPDTSVHTTSLNADTPSKGSDHSTEVGAKDIDETSEPGGTTTPREHQKADGPGKEQDNFGAQCKEFSFRCPLAGDTVLESYPGASWLKPLHEKLMPLFFEICQMDLNARKSQSNRNDQWCFGLDWDRVLKQTCQIMRKFIDTRAELFTKEQVAIDHLLRSLVKHAEASKEVLKHEYECHGQELQHKTSVDLSNPIHKKLILTVEKTGKAYLKTRDPAMFLRLSRMIDFKRPTNVELNPFTKCRCVDYVLGHTALIAMHCIRQLTSSAPFPHEQSLEKDPYPYRYMLLRKSQNATRERGIASPVRMDLITPRELNGTIGGRVRRRKYENLPRGVTPILSPRNHHRFDLKSRASNCGSTYSSVLEFLHTRVAFEPQIQPERDE